jgi:predicted kinase
LAPRVELDFLTGVASAAANSATGVRTSEILLLKSSQACAHSLLLLRRAQLLPGSSSTVILDGTWRDARQRERARELADETSTPIVEFTCSVPLREASARIQGRTESASDATPEIAAAMAERSVGTLDGHPIDTSRPLADSVAEAQQICCLTI